VATAKVFKSGNSQAVRLPKELRLDATEVEVFRHGDLLILRPVPSQDTLAGAFDALLGVQYDFLPEGREPQDHQEREEF
jgi:antitoxin VapB